MKNALTPVLAGLLLSMSAVASGCGGLGAGDHATYEVALETTQYSADCDMQNDPDDSTNIRSGESFFIYITNEGGTDVPYLDLGGIVIDGTDTDDGYEFSGTTTQVDEQGNTTITSVTKIEVSMAFDGTSVAGSSTVDTDTTCKGTGCGNGDSGTCHESTSFTGVELDEPIAVQPS